MPLDEVPSVVRGEDSKDRFLERQECLSKLPALTTQEIARKSIHAIDTPFDELKVVRNHETTDQYGRQISFSGTINNEGQMHGPGKYIDQNGNIREG